MHSADGPCLPLIRKTAHKSHARRRFPLQLGLGTIGKNHPKALFLFPRIRGGKISINFCDGEKECFPTSVVQPSRGLGWQGGVAGVLSSRPCCHQCRCCAELSSRLVPNPLCNRKGTIRNKNQIDLCCLFTKAGARPRMSCGPRSAGEQAARGWRQCRQPLPTRRTGSGQPGPPRSAFCTFPEPSPMAPTTVRGSAPQPFPTRGIPD